VNLLSAFKLIFVSVHTAVIAPVVVAVSTVDEKAAYRVCRLWARVNLLVCGVRVRTRRAPDFDPTRSYVVISNHRSQFDILALVVALQELQLRWVAKKELTNVPIFGWALRHAGHVIIDRSDTAQAVASLRAAYEKLRNGVSVVIFPEGTRAPVTETLLPFKKGGFMLALETGIEVLPVVLLGSDEVLPRNSWSIRAGTIEVVVGSPIPVDGLDREQLMERVRTYMLRELRAAVPAAARGCAVGVRAS
jgi:1-acyl-sn-glycerol-3-phosphate acyltransferase